MRPPRVRTAAFVLVLALTGCGTGPSLEDQGEVTAAPGDSRSR